MTSQTRLNPDNDKYVAIHGAKGGLLAVQVPQSGTRKDFIKLWLRGSNKKKAAWHAMTDWEALQIARMLLWAVSRRNAKIKLEEME